MWGCKWDCCWSWCVVGGVKTVNAEVYSGHAGNGWNAYPGWNAWVDMDDHTVDEVDSEDS